MAEFGQIIVPGTDALSARLPSFLQGLGLGINPVARPVAPPIPPTFTPSGIPDPFTPGVTLPPTIRAPLTPEERRFQMENLPNRIAGLFGLGPVAEARRAKEKEAETSRAKSQEQLRAQLQTVLKAFSPQAQTIRLPGAGTPIPSPILPASPDFSTARTTLEAASPTAPVLPTTGEKILASIGGAAAGARGGKYFGEVLLGAGAGAAAARSRLLEQERAITDRQEERVREHQIRLAQLDVEDAKTRYQADWQKSVLNWQIAVKNAEAAKPQIQATRGGLLISTIEGKDRVIKFMPYGTLNAAGDISDQTKAAMPGGAGWLQGAQSYISTFPDKTVGIAAWTASMLRKGGYVYPPANTTGELKETALKGNAELGITDEQVRRVTLLTQSQLRNMGVPEGTTEYSKRFQSMWDVNMGQTMLQNPQIFIRSFSRVTGSNMSKQ